MRVDLANQIRGVLRPFGLMAGKAGKGGMAGKGGGQAFADRVRRLVADGPLQTVAEALLTAWQAIDSQVRSPSSPAVSSAWRARTRQ